MPSISPYEGIGEVVEAVTVDEANAFLKSGCVLVKVVEKTNIDGSVSIVYVLGRPRTQPPRAQQEPGAQSSDPAARALESLKWTAHKSGGGQWAFYTDATGNLLDALKPAADKIERMKSDPKYRLRVGEWTYGINGRFLNRYPAKGGG